MSTRKVLSLGQCSADNWSISRFIESNFDAAVTAAATFEDALAKLGQDGYALVLVNRVMDHDGRSGLDFIARLKADERLRDVPVMLVSNYDDAQQQAVEKGALPGFGKGALRQAQTLERLRPVLA
jgi:CheY-like chemotaxis protein